MPTAICGLPDRRNCANNQTPYADSSQSVYPPRFQAVKPLASTYALKSVQPLGRSYLGRTIQPAIQGLGPVIQYSWGTSRLGNRCSRRCCEAFRLSLLLLSVAVLAGCAT